MDFNLNMGEFGAEKKIVALDRDRLYDVLIIGGGPAALTAAVYCIRKGVSTGLITHNFGGQVAETWSVENYLGYSYIDGAELVNKFREHAARFEFGFVDGVRASGLRDGEAKTVVLENGDEYRARAIVLCTGKRSRHLDVPGESALAGKGVAYCSTCDAPLFAGKRVAVVGGGNSGIESAIDLARIAGQVTVLQFLDELTADAVLVRALDAYPNVTVKTGHQVLSINGTASVESVTVRDRKTGIESTIAVDGIFVEIGLVPNTDFVSGLIELNEAGEIIIDSACRTSRNGIFAAGDATSVPYKQIIIAAGEGAKAALSACEYILHA